MIRKLKIRSFGNNFDFSRWVFENKKIVAYINPNNKTIYLREYIPSRMTVDVTFHRIRYTRRSLIHLYPEIDRDALCRELLTYKDQKYQIKTAYK